jgi:hypothetical protein
MNSDSVVLSSNGDDCDSNDDCYSNYCLGNICNGNLEDGNICKTGDDCKNLFCN